MTNTKISTAVIVPCYRVKRHILEVLEKIGPEVEYIYCVDDCCPEKSGAFIEEHCSDKRVSVLRNTTRLGVGGAVMRGYRQAIVDGADLLVKLDGDGQMDPLMIPRLLLPIIRGETDYSKGNRFYNLDDLKQMPTARLIGNAALSFLSKISTGYWDIFDPTNGFTALHSKVAQMLPLDKISQDFFFESDILFRLNTIRAVVSDVPMTACYGDESSSLRISRVLNEFAWKHIVNFFKRAFYGYFLRNFNFASLDFLVGLPLLLFGLIFGVWEWAQHMNKGVPATAGTVMLAALPFVLGFQLVLAFFNYDMKDTPRKPLHLRI